MNQKIYTVEHSSYRHEKDEERIKAPRPFFALSLII